jgi:chromosome partitioning related protein ParA
VDLPKVTGQVLEKKFMPNTTVFSVVSTKGGVGKTTLAANLGALFASLGLRVLAIDADMQPSLSKYYKTTTQPTTGLSEVIFRGGLIQSNDIVPTEVVGLDIIMSNLSPQIQAWLKDREDRLILLKRAVRQPVITSTYDVVIFDTQGAKGELQRAAAMAADFMISPLKPDIMSFTEFYTGTLEMLTSINSMADVSAEFRSGPLSIAINCMNRTNNAKLVEEQIRSSFRSYPNVKLLDTRIPDSTFYEQSRTLQTPVHRIDAPTKGKARGNTAYEVMHRLGFELMPNLTGLWADGAPESDSSEA